ncbi:uncharacterized protein GGS22DRAFT_190819 [Annulohypoxylon maeteangense]|uniref:uncharacterized protein n=1 Tax=Annulohypoxylon maeteangense TaxID=1927788 RepID=UPI002008AD1A|nr:uncharacterized protein GGS22DRAFT_190819 [Annulohypoxylon maeteangense]KAI0882841.1 hypothetical protein GGS22DRAFT_190819 [Annulohypoxylon maeteangense]
MADGELQRVQSTLHYVYPLVVFLYFAITSAVAICTLQTSDSTKSTHVRRRVIYYLLLCFVATFAAQVILKAVEIVVWGRWPSQDTIIGLLSCILTFGIEQNSLGNNSGVVWYPFYGSWIIACVLEPINAVLLFIIAQNPITTTPITFDTSALFLHLDASLVIARCVLISSALLAYFLWRESETSVDEDEERAPLIPKPDQRSNGTDNSADSGYGTNSDATNTEATNTETANSPSDLESPWERQQRISQEKIEKRLKNEGNWISYAKGFLIFFPYIWPVNNRRLQLYAALVGLCLLAGNVLNFLIPRQYGAVMDSLSGVSGGNPWIQVAIFAGLRLLASEAGINLLRQMLWLPIEYYSEEALTAAAYSHIMNLSSEFHDSKSSSDLIVAISNGTSISNMLDSICFQALPMLIDLVIAFTYLSTKFGPYEGFITIATSAAFIQSATHIIGSFQEKRKIMVRTYFEEHYIRQAGIQGWQTVSAFNQVPYEERRYGIAVNSHVSAAKALYSSYFVGHAFQYLILLAGLLAGAFLAVYQITHGQATAGDFVMLLTYWSQLTAPLRFFSQLGKNISQDLVHAEQLLDVMTTKPTVVEKPDARPLKLKGGKVEFRNVSFSYDKKKDILKCVNVSVPSGTTVAFVGATGAGKSTILKLLDRFYDVTGGSIQIDSQDIRDVTISSLRQSIGIVPQSPVLFDDTVMNNIRYARLTATDEEVYSACKAAAIHDHIMGFTEGYTTRVGERGVKLSGGELQRIAIARAILKEPEIVLLDEATSSVDTDTEQKIQEGLRALCQGRTTFIVAHRLSTVMNADTIFVVANGEIAEQGNHEVLIAQKGKYAELWSKQIFVKSKESKDEKENEGDVDTMLATTTQTDGSADEHTNGAKIANGTQAKRSTPKVTTSVSTGKTNGQAVKTPNGHTKEGSKLNPGAPEFTPRSVAVPRPIITPTRNSWAEDVEQGCCRDIPSSLDVERASISTAIRAFETSPSSKHGDAVSPILPPGSITPQNVFEAPDSKPRRNTLQSISCPEGPSLSFPDSPARSVSQPVPTPPAANSSQGENTKPSYDGEDSSPSPDVKPSQEPANKRGGFRGKYRGRYRGGRGRRRNPSSTKSSHKDGIGASQKRRGSVSRAR